jgi:hypothetical protein
MESLRGEREGERERERERENLLTLSLWSITLHEQRTFDYLAPEL